MRNTKDADKPPSGHDYTPRRRVDATGSIRRLSIRKASKAAPKASHYVPFAIFCAVTR